MVPFSVLSQTGDIQGTVYQRSTGKPLTGADVRITETEQTQKTDENGIFQFTELPEGTYTFVVTHPTETAPTAVSVAISSGGTTENQSLLRRSRKIRNHYCRRKTSTANDQSHRNPRQRTPTHSRVPPTTHSKD